MDLTHKEVTETIDNSMVFAWDFILSDGDTIKEKSEGLLRTVAPWFLDKADSTKPMGKLIGRRDFTSVFEVSAIFFGESHDPEKFSFQFITETEWQDEECKEVRKIGTIRRSCGANGYCTNFELYVDDKMGDELLAIHHSGHRVLKIFNWVI